MLIRYTKDVIKGHDVEVGQYTYGIPTVHSHPGRRLRIGKFCSMASGVTMPLGENHATEAVSTYPFGAFVDDWPEARVLDNEYLQRCSEGDAPGSKGDVVIANDVWIGKNAMILSGSTIGDRAVIGAVVIGDDSSACSAARFAPGSSVGNHVLVAMGSVVTKSLDNNINIMMGGVPAAIIPKEQSPK